MSDTAIELKEKTKTSGTWKFTIENFSKYNEIDQVLKSPNFGLADDDVWYLEIYPNGEESNNGKFVSIYFCCETLKDHVELKLKYKISIISTKLEKSFEIQGYHSGNIHHLGWGLDSFVKRAILLAQKDLYLPNDTLTVSCKITRSFYHHATELISVPVSQHFKNLQSLLQHGDVGDFITLRVCQINQKSSTTPSSTSTKSSVDLSPQKKKLKTDDNDEINENTVESRDFKVYQGILTCQSSVFEAMLKHREIKENQENLIEINDMDPKVFAAMLHFFHQDQLLVSENNLLELLAAADKYKLMRLKALCEEALFKTLTIENSLIKLRDADVYNAGQLKDATIQFIVENIGEIKKSDEYKLFKQKNLALALEIFEKFYEQQKEDDFHGVKKLLLKMLDTKNMSVK